jgi:RNA 3'-terminal phosphate cyclase (ATP)
MIVVDGSQGEGGGQMLRSCLSLSTISGRPLRIEKIRARRSKPGLMRQHLTAVQAAQQVSNAKVKGAEIGSAALVFEPGEIRPGDYRLAIGTAGSTTLVLQTLLPALLGAASASRLTLEGGTHNPLAPPWDFLDRTFLPLLRRMGAGVAARLERYGFYPAGGGRVVAEIEPCNRLSRLELLRVGETRPANARILVSKLPEHVARREAKTIVEMTGWRPEQVVIETVDSPGPGNVALIFLGEGELVETIAAFGEKGVAAENVAAEAVQIYRRHYARQVPVGEHLADQLLLPMALGEGGTFLTGPLSGHTTTQIELLERFLPVKIVAEQQPERRVLVRVEPIAG